jgi:hypothetical protein|tara:strand:+ start:76 stop:303 length:228 start_codon:yes stop_codon:yes gene_type:complete
MTDSKKFIKDVNYFYGQDQSISGKEFFPDTGGVTTAEIVAAIEMRKLNISIPFEGDYTDREMVKELMLEERRKLA